MKSTLIIYSTTDGQTKNICSRIGEFLSNDTPPKIISLNEATKDDIKKYDQVIIGASIRYGKHKRELFEFININLDELTKKDNAFFSVNVVARKSEKNTPETNPYMQKFLLKTSWVPQKQEDKLRELIGVPEEMAFTAMIPLGQPVKQLTKLKRNDVHSFTVLEHWNGENLVGS